jgi:catechol 2,3-dioxygenase-like lactoylglutathione lyase family enzyme
MSTRVTGLDHVVLNVTDVERSVSWWVDHFGVEPVRLEEWRRGEAPFASLRVDATTIIDLLAAERTGQNVDHIALVVDATSGDLATLAASGEVEVVRPLARLFGAQGWGTGLHVRDPDGNVVELRTYR